MNVRIHRERTPVRRLAALLREYLSRFLIPPPPIPDYADIAKDIELYVHREEFAIRMNEIQAAIVGTTEDPQYFRHRIVVLEALAHANEQEIDRNGILK